MGSSGSQRRAECMSSGRIPVRRNDTNSVLINERSICGIRQRRRRGEGTHHVGTRWRPFFVLSAALYRCHVAMAPRAECREIFCQLRVEPFVGSMVNLQLVVGVAEAAAPAGSLEFLQSRGTLTPCGAADVVQIAGIGLLADGFGRHRAMPQKFVHSAPSIFAMATAISFQTD